MRADETTARKRKRMGFSLCGLEPQEREQPAAKRQKQTTTGNESNTATKKISKSQTHITKPHNNIKLPSRSNHKENSIQLSKLPTRTRSPAESNRNAAKEKEEKEFFLLLSDRHKTNLNQQQKRNNRFFSRHQTVQSSSRSPVAINLNPHKPQALATARRKRKDVLLWSRTTNSTMPKRQRRRELSDSR